ncbi:MAG: hypothetical protein KIT32_12310 [Rhodocyclaceae bacterium]|nr:hypothetical protein [Rhodocyclaceae bacterium]
MFAPFGAFAPDQPVLGQTGASVAKNVVPLTDKSYGPFPGLTTVTGALTARCQGFASFRASDGTSHIFAGDATKLYKLNADGVTWDDVSKSGGYTTPADGRWYFAQYGNRVMATNYADAIQSFVIGTDSAFSDLSANAPKARFIDVIRGFVVVADTWDATDGYNQNRVWWSAFGDPTSWPTPGGASAAAVQSDFQDIAFGGGINGLLGGVGGSDGVIFLQNAIVRMTYSGPPAVFTFQDAERGTRGTTIAGSVINAGTFGGYLGEDGFYLFDGISSHPIGNLKVDRWVWDSIDQTQLVRVCAAVNPKKKLIFWAFPTGSSDGNPNRILIYNWETGWWSYADVDVEFIGKGFSAGYTLEGLDAITTDIEALPYSLDSVAYMGGRVNMAGFYTDHKFGFFDGDALAATLETGEFPIEGGRRVFVGGVRPLVDGGTITAAVGYRETPQASVTYSTATSAAADGVCPQRVSARYARARVSVAAAGTWTHAQGVEAEARQEGMR